MLTIDGKQMGVKFTSNFVLNKNKKGKGKKEGGNVKIFSNEPPYLVMLTYVFFSLLELT